MAIQFNILSAHHLILRGNKPAISGFKTVEVDERRDDGLRDQSTSASDDTFVEGDGGTSSRKTVDWVAGVGDINNGRAREESVDGDKTGKGVLTQLQYASKWNAATKQKPKSSRKPSSPNTRGSALRRHCDFWDADGDGMIYPWDIFIGFRNLGFNIALCLWAAVTMAICSSYSTQPTYFLHPLFAINLHNINRGRHGSTTGAYDMDSELDTRRFDAIFEKYAGGKDYLTRRTMYDVWAGQCCANDFYGWFAGLLESGRIYKEDLRGVYDGTIFWKISEARAVGQWL
ncbi:caleosin domain-containing protein [Stemphylium lycopersici]|nr:caleosin domain-containing protein [Stemphylium lycopersici]